MKSRIYNRYAGRLWRRQEKRALDAVRRGDICHFWPGASPDSVRASRQKGAITVVEFINTYATNYASIMREAAADRGLPVDASGDEGRAYDDAMLTAADIAFDSGPFIGESIRRLAAHVPMMLETSYGSEYPETLPPRPEVRERIRFLCVAFMGLRKGTYDLLDAWEAADLDAELVLVGKLEPAFSERLKRATKNVTHVPFTHALSEIYRDADVFVLPSLEEGDPLVTHTATAYGLPLIVTPMGGGRSANDDNALFVPPRDPAALAAALRTLAGDRERLQRMSVAARQSARRFDYRVVARDRIEKLLAAAEVIESGTPTRAAPPSSS